MMTGKTDFEKFFQDADQDKDGYVCLEELCAILDKYGYRCSEEDVKAFFKKTDTSGDNKISFAEYMEVMESGRMRTELHDEATMRRVFALFDKDGNGAIDASELRAIFAEMGKHFTEAEVMQMINRCDMDGSQTLDYEEFIKAAKEKKLAP